MAQILTAKIATYLKADTQKLGKDMPDSDKVRVAPGDVVEASPILVDKSFFVVRGAQLNGEPVPDHIIYAYASHWTLAEKSSTTDDAAPVTAIPAPGREEKQAHALKMLDEGRSVSAIAKELRVGRASIKRWRDEAQPAA